MRVFSIISLLLMSACSSSQRASTLQVPYEAMESVITEAKGNALFTDTHSFPEEWWTLFNDPQLSNLIETSLAKNPTVHAAKAQINAAYSIADRVRSTLYPTLTWGGDVSRQKLSETGVIPFNTSPPASGISPISVPVMPGGAIPEYFTLYETELNLHYNFDFWDKNKNTLRAALGEVYSRAAELSFVNLSLGIRVAEVYFQLQTDYALEKIAKDIVANREKYAALVKKRIQAHLDNELALKSAEINVSTARQVLLSIEGNIAVNEYQLQAYTTDFNEQVGRIAIEELPLPKVPLPSDLPLHLLAQRPDVTAQLWLIESAGRQIEVAKAGFYPDFNLFAFFGYQTIHFREWFKWPSSYFNVDPAFTLPIFDGGRLLANLRGSEVNYDLAIFEYNHLVLEAVKDVLQAIAVLRNQDQQLMEYQNKTSYQKEVNALTALRVKHNLSDALTQLDSEEKVLETLDQEVRALGSTIQAILSLIKALGGGYYCDGH